MTTMIHEPDDGAVKLDYVQARGHMGYPPILNRWVWVHLHRRHDVRAVVGGVGHVGGVGR